jgi:hypothetical protein
MATVGGSKAYNNSALRSALGVWGVMAAKRSLGNNGVGWYWTFRPHLIQPTISKQTGDNGIDYAELTARKTATQTSAVVNSVMHAVHDGAHATGEEIALPLHVDNAKFVRYAWNDVGNGEMEPVHAKTPVFIRCSQKGQAMHALTTSTLPMDSTRHDEGTVHTPVWKVLDYGEGVRRTTHNANLVIQWRAHHAGAVVRAHPDSST